MVNDAPPEGASIANMTTTKEETTQTLRDSQANFTSINWISLSTVALIFSRNSLSGNL